MSNSILSEIIAHEQRKDRLKQAEQYRRVNVESAHQPADRFDLRTSLGNLLIAARPTHASAGAQPTKSPSRATLLTAWLLGRTTR
jgi:hypothetical protein